MLVLDISGSLLGEAQLDAGAPSSTASDTGEFFSRRDARFDAEVSSEGGSGSVRRTEGSWIELGESSA